MRSDLRILVLHNLENLHAARRSALDYVFSFERYAPRHDYVYHRICFPPTEAIRNTEWDAVIFESTSLGICTFRPKDLFLEQKKRWSFLAERSCVKVAFPQDDANHSGVLDDWFTDYNFDAVFSVRPEHREVLYPKTSQRVEFFSVLSGYIDDISLPALAAFAKPFHERSRLIGQRVTMYPPRGGRQGRLKGVTAEMVREGARVRGIPTDISTDPKDVLYSDDWPRFLGDCKFVLGSEGGLSILDPYGEIYDTIEEYAAAHPQASFEEIEAACFPGLDGQHIFPGFSPRILEAAACGCCQILVEGRYLGILTPYEHYIPLKPDGSNLDEVFELIRDEVSAKRRIAATYTTLVKNPDFRFSRFVARVISYIKAKRAREYERKSFPFEEVRRAHWQGLGRELRHSEKTVGFKGAALRERVGSLMAAQYAPPFGLIDGQSAKVAEAMGAFGRWVAGGDELREAEANCTTAGAPNRSDLPNFASRAIAVQDELAVLVVDVLHTELEIVRLDGNMEMYSLASAPSESEGAGSHGSSHMGRDVGQRRSELVAEANRLLELLSERIAEVTPVLDLLPRGCPPDAVAREFAWPAELVALLSALGPDKEGAKGWSEEARKRQSYLADIANELNRGSASEALCSFAQMLGAPGELLKVLQCVILQRDGKDYWTEADRKRLADLAEIVRVIETSPLRGSAIKALVKMR